MTTRSDYFRALLVGNFSESRSDAIEVADVENPELFAALLRFLYTRQVDITGEVGAFSLSVFITWVMVFIHTRSVQEGGIYFFFFLRGHCNGRN